MPEAGADVVGSIKDARVASLRGLSSAAARRAAGLCLIEGRTLLDQILDTAAVSGVAPIRIALQGEGTRAPEDGVLAGRLRAAGVTVHRVRDGVLRQLAGAARPIGWLAGATLPPEAAVDDEWGDFVVVCENVADPGNLGTIVRSAQALGVREIVLTDRGADMGARRVIEASRGAVLAARVRRFPSSVAAVQALRTAGFQVVVTSPRGRQIQALAPVQGSRVALVVGNEAAGISPDVEAAADLVVQIPMSGQVESLNVGVAAGISLYELRTRMVLTMLTDRIRATLGREIALTGRLVRTVLDEATRSAAGLSSNQVIALMIVAAERTTSYRELQADLGVGSGELVEAVAPLTERGWLVATEGDKTVGITLAGEQALAGLWPIQQRVEEEVCAELSDTERATLITLLRRVQGGARRRMAGRGATDGDAGN